jgi:hypothetical protein
MGSDAMMFQAFKKLIGEGFTDMQQGDLIGLLLFFQNRESRPKIN